MDSLPGTLPTFAFAPETLVDILRWRAVQQPEKRAYTFLVDGESEEETLTYGALNEKVRAIASRLLEACSSNDRVLLLYPPGLDYIAAFFACLYAGVVAVPAYPPRFKNSMERLQTIVSDAQALTVLTVTKIAALPMMQTLAQAAGLRILTTDRPDLIEVATWQPPKIAATHLAFLQYTSGSTGLPKGVMVTHNNLLYNQQMMQHIFQVTQESIIVSWLPLYHDMGLIGNILQPLYTGVPAILMSPLHFVQRPLRWLQAISRYQATISGAPNFAYDLCARKITAEQKDTLDLSSWHVAYNGSEPIRAETLYDFSAAFQLCGFHLENFQPCYGLAEATLVVTGSKISPAPVIRAIDAAALRDGHIINKAPLNGANGSQELVSCGGLPGQRLAIVDVEGHELPDGQIGEIWIAGPSVAQGYWNQPEETRRIFGARLAESDEGPFLRTGDLGFLQHGELFITGRSKDVIIIRGRNHYPQDIERTVEQSYACLQPHGGAVFSVEVEGEERLVVVQEVERGQQENVAEIMAAIRQEVTESHEVQVYAVVLVKRGSIPKTSSGKIQRQHCKKQYLAGALDIYSRDTLANPNATTDEAIAKLASDITRPALLTMEPEQRQSVTETYLQEQIALILGISSTSFSVEQPLSGLGLDSLRSIELQHKIEETLQVVLSPSIFLQGFNIAQIAAQILTEFDSSAPSSSISLRLSEEHTQDAPLSQGQQAMWFLYQLAPESSALNIFITLHIRSELDLRVLCRAFERLIERHAALRTTYTVRDGQPVQIVHPDRELDFEEIDTSGWKQDHLRAMLLQEADRPFDLEQGSVLRVKLFTRSTEEYLLSLTIHHIAVDLWSLEILIDEFRLFYSQEINGTDADIPLPGFRYVDYVHFQQEMLASPASEQHWRYWQAHLHGDLPALNLPTERLPAPVRTYRGDSYPFKVDEYLTSELKKLSNSAGVTLYVTLLAAFQVLLYRYTGSEDILIGSPVAGRSRAQLEGLVGLFVNHVVLRADCSHNPTFRSFLAQTYQTVLAALEHQDYPFPLLVERLKLTRDSSQAPLFQVAFVWGQTRRVKEHEISLFSPFMLDDTGIRLDWKGFLTEPVAVEQRGAPFDLTLTIYERSASLSASLQYNSDLFNRETIASIVKHFQILLKALVTHTDAPISSLPLLTEGEQQYAVKAYKSAYGITDKTIQGLFEACVQRDPDACALSFQSKRVSYRDLNGQGNRIAHAAKHLGIEPRQVIGVMVEYGPFQIAALLGILKAGCAFVCLDPNYPAGRLQHILEEVETPLLLADTSCVLRHRELLAQLGQKYTYRIVVSDASGDQVQQFGLGGMCLSADIFTSCLETNLDESISSLDPAYVVYTSGSTGRPKGIVQSHQSFCQFLEWQSKQFGIHAAKRIAQWASVTYDASYCEIFGALCFGATLCMNIPLIKHDPSAVIDWVRDEQISLLQMVPGFCQQVLRVLETEYAHTESQPFPQLEAVLLSGESLPVGMARAWLKHFPEQPTLYNLYGPTEAVLATYHAVRRVETHQRSIPIGHAIDGRQVLILDKGKQLCPVGVQGEIYIRSQYLTSGYFRQQEETQKFFRQNPLHNSYLDPVYRTGDLGRLLPDGNIEFYGRIDNQVKIRGMRVELEEIETILSQHELVKESAVNIYAYGQREETQQTLVAYVVASASISAATLRRFLQETLPGHMVPAVFLFLDVLPRTRSGKLDRQALPLPALQTVNDREHYRVPQTEQEKRIAKIWQDLLSIDMIGLDDNFFALGGHSLLAMQVVNRLRETFSINLSMRSFFEAATLADLARTVEAARNLEEKNKEKVAQIMQRIQQLSDNEVTALLRARSEQSAAPR